MTEQHLREIAKVAFRRYFLDVDIIKIDVKPGFLHFDEDRPAIDVTISFDGSKYDKSYTAGLMKVNSEILDKAWLKKEQDFGYPYVFFKPVVDDSDSANQ